MPTGKGYRTTIDQYPSLRLVTVAVSAILADGDERPLMPGLLNPSDQLDAMMVGLF